MKLDLSKDFERKKALNYLNDLIKKNKKIELKEVKRKRTIQQNKYLHKIICLYGINFGYTLEEAKTLLKRGAQLTYVKDGNTFLMQTRSMESDALAKFIEWIRNHSSANGYYIASSEEYLQNQFEIDKEIYNNQSFL